MELYGICSFQSEKNKIDLCIIFFLSMYFIASSLLFIVSDSVIYAGEMY